MKCRFCQGKMEENGTITNGYSTPNYRVVASIYLCKRCHSFQTFSTTGQALEYDFRVGDCRLYFYPQGSKFIIKRLEDHYLQTVLLELQTCPTHLTPQNTNMERVKLMLLFS